MTNVKALRALWDAKVAAGRAYTQSRAAYGSEEDRDLCAASVAADDAFEPVCEANFGALLALAEAVRELAPAIRTLAHPTSDHPHAVAARRVLAILEGK